MTKTVTEVALLGLADEGRLGLDQPLGELLPAGFLDRLSGLGDVLVGLAIEHLVGEPLHAVYRARILDLLSMDATYLEGDEPARGAEPAHHYRGSTDLSAVTPTIDWAGGGLVTTGRTWLALCVACSPVSPVGGAARGEDPLDAGSALPAGHRCPLRRLRARYRMHHCRWRRADRPHRLLGRFRLYAPEHDGVLIGTHNDATVDLAPLVAELCRALRI